MKHVTEMKKLIDEKKHPKQDMGQRPVKNKVGHVHSAYHNEKHGAPLSK